MVIHNTYKYLTFLMSLLLHVHIIGNNTYTTIDVYYFAKDRGNNVYYYFKHKGPNWLLPETNNDRRFCEVLSDSGQRGAPPSATSSNQQSNIPELHRPETTT